MPGEEHAPDAREFVGKTRLEAFSDGVFAIAITLLVLDLAIPESGPALDRVLDAWPFYLAYVVSFLTIGATWIAHTAITDRLARADLGLLRLNLLLLDNVRRSILPVVAVYALSILARGCGGAVLRHRRGARGSVRRPQTCVRAPHLTPGHSGRFVARPL